MRCSIKKIALIVLCIYLGVTCYTSYLLIKKKINDDTESSTQKYLKKGSKIDGDEWNPWGEEFEKEVKPLNSTRLEKPNFHIAKKVVEKAENVQDLKDEEKNLVHQEELVQYDQFDGRNYDNLNAEGENGEKREVTREIEVWGKAAIGLYFWEHIMDSPLETKMGGVWKYGEKQIHNMKFRFRTGPGVLPNKVPQDVRNLVLVLNGREATKVQFAKDWLDWLPNYKLLQNVAVILLGNEQCKNDWIKPYLYKNGGLVKVVFLVYDSPDVDNDIFYQWPLGVATYRGFPKKLDLHTVEGNISLSIKRPYVCNFMGTVYKGSSREIISQVINKDSLRRLCYIKERKEWLPNESEETLNEYVSKLSQSDLTLNPVGKNTECYRLYEALSFGSVPVVEDIMTPGNCGEVNRLPGNAHPSHDTPLRLLKQYGAPFIYIKNWTTISDLILSEQNKSFTEILDRRKNVLKWYSSFLSKMQLRFIDVIKEKFTFN